MDLALAFFTNVNFYILTANTKGVNPRLKCLHILFRTRRTLRYDIPLVFRLGAFTQSNVNFVGNFFINPFLGCCQG